jgi:hypothetical protein
VDDFLPDFMALGPKRRHPHNSTHHSLAAPHSKAVQIMDNGEMDKA